MTDDIQVALGIFIFSVVMVLFKYFESELIGYAVVYSLGYLVGGFVLRRLGRRA